MPTLAWLLGSALMSAASVADTSGAPTLAARLARADARLYGVHADSSIRELEALAADARAARDRSVQGGALVLLAEARNVRFGAVAALATVDSAARVLPPRAELATARLECGRAYYLLRLGRPGIPEALARGHAAAQRSGDARARALCVLMEGAWQVNVEEDEVTAPPLLDSAEVIARRAGEGKLHASVQFWRGYDRFTLARYADAKALLRACASEGEATGNLRTAAWAYRYLHAIAAQHGDLGTAAAELDRADALFRRVGDREGLAQVEAVRGGTAALEGDWDAVERSARRLLATAQESGIASLEQRARNALVRAELWRGRYASAQVQTDSLRRFLATHGLSAFASDLEYGEGLIALGLGEPAAAERHFAAYLATASAPSHLQRYMARARLAEAAARRGELDLAERRLAQAFAELEAVRDSAADLRPLAFQAQTGWGDPDVGFSETLARLVEAGRVEAAFGFAERRRARVLGEQLGRSATWQTPDVARAVPAHGALLEFVTGRSGAPTVLLLASASVRRGYRLPPIDSLAPDIRRLVTLLEAGDDGAIPARRLGEALLASALRDLPHSVDRLVIVPDDEVHRVPFDALVLPDGSRVLDRFATSFVPSASVALALAARADGAGGRVLAFADPRFAAERPGGEAETLRAAFDSSGGLERLPATAAEAGILAGYAPDARVRVRGEASEALLKRDAAGSFRVVHFATHAVVDERSAARTALALAPGEGEDGFVSVAELAAIRMHAALVVLSACRTARGVVLRGEGVEGLVTPLLAAGARSVVATQWRIGDRATLRAVDALYGALASGAPVDVALRRARLAVRARGAPARDWAAFALVGDADTRVALAPPGLGARLRAWWAMR